MSNTHTRIVFCVKNELILEGIEKEFLDCEFSIKQKISDSIYKVIELDVNKIVALPEDGFVTINGYKCQFESLAYYNKENPVLPEIKTKCIQITTTDTEGFSEMSGLVGAIDKLTKNLDANYKIDYFFK